ncbi:unnamed protein product [Parnassius mnemosyne]|uniref:BESS domain-containing protein n=1 Tax=Parnassius mnemosyne TaxID=213953 RepID=A0AAV1M0L3_9NEOP
MKKWKSIRDNYLRESKKQKKLPSGSGSSKHTPYVYYRKLQFLANSTAYNDTESNYQSSGTTGSDVDNIIDNADLMPFLKDQMEGPRKRQKINAVDKQIVDILQKSLNAREQNEMGRLTKEDDDKLFCLSLYSELKKVPENRRLTTKIKLLNVIKEAQNYHQSLPLETNHHTHILHRHILDILLLDLQQHNIGLPRRHHRRHHGHRHVQPPAKIQTT